MQNITISDPFKIKYFLRSAAKQADLIKSIVVTADDGFTSPQEDLKSFLGNSEWAPAVDPSLILDETSEQEKVVRAQNIMDIFVPEGCKDRVFGDYGCGEGHVVTEAKLRGARTAVGYDVAYTGSDPNITNDKEKFFENQPFNSILLFDVLDHIVDEDVIDVLTRLRKSLVPGGLIHVRCHPWCSRHGTHLYKSINKAFVHMIVPEDELKSLGYVGIPTQMITHPIDTYKRWFSLSGLSVVTNDIIREPVETFFYQFDEIKKWWKDSPVVDLANGTMFPTFQMEQQFHDYTLRAS